MSENNPTPAELLAMKNGIDDRIAIANLPGLKAIQAALKSGKVATFSADIEALLPQLAPDSAMGTPFNMASSIATNLRGVTDFFDREVARVEALAQAQQGSSAASSTSSSADQA